MALQIAQPIAKEMRPSTVLGAQSRRAPGTTPLSPPRPHNRGQPRIRPSPRSLKSKKQGTPMIRLLQEPPSPPSASSPEPIPRARTDSPRPLTASQSRPPEAAEPGIRRVAHQTASSSGWARRTSTSRQSAPASR